MSDASSSSQSRGAEKGDRLLTASRIEAILGDFRRYLERVSAGAEPMPEPPRETVDLATVVDAFTALRHEVHLQTKSTRSLTEQIATLLESQGGSQANATASRSAPEDAEKPLIAALMDAYDALALAAREVNRPRPAPPQAGLWSRLFGPPPALTTPDAVFDGLMAGYRLSMQRIERALAKSGLEPIAVAGQLFDPELMEALEAVATAEQPAGSVVDELRRGYRRSGRVYRFAQVRVAR